MITPAEFARVAALRETVINAAMHWHGTRARASSHETRIAANEALFRACEALRDAEEESE